MTGIFLGLILYAGFAALNARILRSAHEEDIRIKLALAQRGKRGTKRGSSGRG